MKNEKPVDPVQDYRTITAEVREWEIHLNKMTGMIAFTFSIASLGTPQPPLWAFISLIFLLIFHISTTKGKMLKLKSLDAKKERSDYENYLRSEIRKNIKVRNAPAFIIGMSLLFFLSAAPDIYKLPNRAEFLKGLYGKEVSGVMDFFRATP